MKLYVRVKYLTEKGKTVDYSENNNPNRRIPRRRQISSFSLC
ncbi:MAG: hypothetical protein QXU44_06665 [Candidatus Caldarchaeum sp.]